MAILRVDILRKKIIFRIFVTILALSVNTAAAKNEAFSHADENNILADINIYRSQRGLRKLLLNQFLSEEATKHSEEMAQKKVSLGHDGFGTRMDRIFSNFTYAQGIAENVAFTWGDSRAVTAQWLASAGHRKNIEGNYNLTGLGIAHDSSGRVYVTQIFIYDGTLR